MNSTFGSVGCGSMLWGMSSVSVPILVGYEVRDVDADKPDAMENGAGQNGGAEEKNARLMEDMVKKGLNLPVRRPLIATNASVT
jgi:hypothetical protein